MFVNKLKLFNLKHLIDPESWLIYHQIHKTQNFNLSHQTRKYGLEIRCSFLCVYFNSLMDSVTRKQ